MKCRHCNNALKHVFVDLGFAPPSNAYLTIEELNQPEKYFPLKLYVCEKCWLVQTEDYARADELFRSDYAYFSSVSSSWLKHAAEYATMIQKRLNLGKNSFVIEVASNDGYLLKNFVAAGIPCLGIEPTDSTAAAAEDLGITVVREFFGQDFADRLTYEDKQADLIIANNVYAHVPDINDFTLGLKAMLKPGGTITLEFPHLMRLIDQNQFDTIYHEHFSYLSLATVCKIFEHSGLRVFDVEEIPTHGGSLRVYGSHMEDSRPKKHSVFQLIQKESKKGLHNIDTYFSFQPHADRIKNNLLSFLIEQKRTEMTVVGYGAAAKGNTLLNYSGVKGDLLSVVFDAAPSKQGKVLPGSHIPIVSPEILKEMKPDWILILPWNIADEIMTQHEYVHNWGGKFMVAVPQIRVLS